MKRENRPGVSFAENRKAPIPYMGLGAGSYYKLKYSDTSAVIFFLALPTVLG